MSKKRKSVKVAQKGTQSTRRPLTTMISDGDCISEQAGDHLLNPIPCFQSPMNSDTQRLQEGLVFKRERQIYLEGFFEALLMNDIDNAHQMMIVKRNYMRMTFHVIKCLSNLVGLTVYVIDTYKSIGRLDDPDNIIDIIDVSVAILFTIEYADDLRRSHNKIRFVYSSKSIIDLLTILPIYISYLWTSHTLLIILKVLRSLRIVRLFNLFLYFLQAKQNGVFLSNQEQNADYYDKSQNGKVTLQIYKILAHILSIMFMSTGVIMMFEELLPNRAFKLYDKYTQMDFIKGLYFMIVTISTIGYGDIYPGCFWVRIWLMFTLFLCVAVISNDITNLSLCLANVSDYEKNYKFENHVVVVGSYNTFYLWDFVHNFFGDLEHMTKSEEIKETKMIIVGESEPNNQVSVLLDDLKLQDKIYYLKAPLLEQSFFIQSNVRKARALFAFCDSENDNEQELFLFCKDLHFVAPSVDIIFYHGKHKAHKGVKINFKIKESFHAQSLKNYLLGTMVINKGLQVHIGQVMQETKMACKIDNDLCKKYADAYLQGIQVVKAPSYFIGLKTKSAAKILFFSSLLFNKKNQSETQFCDFNTSAVIMLGVQKSKYIRKVDEKMQLKTFFRMEKKKHLINYFSDHKIHENDFLIVYCHRDQISFIQNFSVNDVWKYEKMVNILDFGSDESHEEIQRMMMQSFRNLKVFNNFSSGSLQYKVTTFQKQASDNPSQIINQLKPHHRLSLQNHSEYDKDLSISKAHSVTSQKVENGYLNLFANSDQSIELQIQDHIIIIGPQSGLFHIIKAIRRYTNRYIIFFTEQIYVEKNFKRISELGYIVYTYGSYFNINHLRSLQLSKSFRILLLMHKTTIESKEQDPDCQILQRAIYQLAPSADIIFEIQENQSLNYSVQKPSQDFEEEFSFYPQLITGNVFVGSSLYKVIAQSVFNDSLIQYIKTTIGSNIHSVEDKNEHKLVQTLTIDKEMAENFLVYGVLANHLYLTDLIPLAIVTAENTPLNKVIEQEQKEKEIILNKIEQMSRMSRAQSVGNSKLIKMGGLSQLVYSQHSSCNSDEQKIIAYQEKMKIKERINLSEWKGNTVISNPPALHQLRAGDKILVFGSIDLSHEQKNQLFLQSPAMARRHVQRRTFLLPTDIKLKNDYINEDETISIQPPDDRLNSSVHQIKQPKNGQDRIELRSVVLMSLKTLIHVVKQMDSLQNSHIQRMSTQ